MGGIRRFPRALATAALLGVAAFGATSVAGAADLDAVKARAQSVADEITAFEQRLADLADERRALDRKIEQSSIEIGALEVEIRDAERAYGRAHSRFEQRAIEAYKAGPSAELSLLLSAQNLNDMYTVSEAISNAAAVDQAAIADVLAAKRDAEDAQSHLDERKQQLMAEQAKSLAISEQIETAIGERNEIFVRLKDEIAELQRQARIEAEKAEQEAEAAAIAGTPLNPTWGTHAADRLVGTGPSNGIPAGFQSTGVAFEGIASWYGPGFEGNTTANGDIFDSRLYTAASRTLPFETYLYVEHEGRGVVVYVNDRGPYSGDRILDLSRAAAAAIGTEHSGVGWIRAEIILKTR